MVRQLKRTRMLAACLCWMVCGAQAAMSPDIDAANAVELPSVQASSGVVDSTVSAGVVSRIDALFASASADQRVPGAAVAVYQGGALRFSRGYGYADLEQGVAVTARTPFMVASVSKQFCAFAIALLASEGRLDLEADIRRYLPYVPDFGHVITVRDLVHHTSGLRDQFALFELRGDGGESVMGQADVVSLVRHQQALNFVPGQVHAYSNTGYTLMAEIVHAVSGKTLREFTSERMFVPLGMTQTFFLDDVARIVPGRAHSYRDDGDGGWRKHLLNDSTVGATSLVTTVEDLARWARNLSHPTVGDAALIRQVTTPGKLSDGSTIPYGFGLQLNPGGAPAVYHSGSEAGFRAFFAYYPERDLAVVVAANSAGSNTYAQATAIGALFGAASQASADRVPPEVTPRDAVGAGLAGTYYRAHDVSFSLAWKDGALRDVNAGAEPYRFRRDGSFDRGTRSYFFRPLRDRSGMVAGIEQVIHGHDSIISTRVTPEDLAGMSVAGIAGDYRSQELDVTYTFEAAGEGLQRSSLSASTPIRYAPLLRDRFENRERGETVWIERDPQGQVSGILLGTGRGVRQLALKKVPSP